MMARMKTAPFRVISLVAVCAALAGGCENDYEELSDDLLTPGWGDPAPALPTCAPAMDASTGSPDAGGSPDTGTPSDTGTQSDTGANGDSGAADAGNTPDAGTSDANAADTGSPDV